MNEEDKFEARHQEIHDENTGVTVTFGTHASADALPAGQSPGQAGGRQGLRWMRIAVPYGNPDNPTEAGETKTSTITFGPDGQALKILPHVQSTDAGDVTDAPPSSEEDPEQSLPDKSDEVDKPTKRGKK